MKIDSATRFFMKCNWFFCYFFSPWFILFWMVSCSTGTVIMDSKFHHSMVPPSHGISIRLVPEKKDVYNEFLISLFQYQFSKQGISVVEEAAMYEVQISYTIQKSRDVKSFYILTDPYGFHTTSIQTYEMYQSKIQLQVFDSTKALVWTGIAREENSCPSIIPNSPRLVVTLVRYFLQEQFNFKQNYPPWDEEIRDLKKKFSYVNFSC